jgi:hypothetical protein
VGDGRGEERRRRRRWRKRDERRWFGGKRLSADLEGDVAYIEPPPFVTGRIPNHD